MSSLGPKTLKVNPIEPYPVKCVDAGASDTKPVTNLTVGRHYMVTGRALKHLVQVRDDRGLVQIFHESRFEEGPKCQYCGESIGFWYGYQLNESLAQRKICLRCSHWLEVYEALQAHKPGYYIIDNVAFHDQGDNTRTIIGERGFGGSRFYIVDNDGNHITTNNLNSLGDVPPVWQDKILNNAWFANSRWEKALY